MLVDDEVVLRAARVAGAFFEFGDDDELLVLAAGLAAAVLVATCLAALRVARDLGVGRAGSDSSAAAAEPAPAKES